MSSLLLLTNALQPSTEVLPALGLLLHNVRVAPAEGPALVDTPGADVILIDGRRDLPQVRSLCQLLRSTGPGCPLILVVTEGGLAAVTADWGIDDVLLDTAGPAEVEARLRLAMGRQQIVNDDSPMEIRNGDLSVDEATYSAKLKGRVLDLTFKEFELLKYLAQHPGRVFTRAQLLQEVWGYDYFGGTRTVDVHVRRLRAKLGPRARVADRDRPERRLSIRYAGEGRARERRGEGQGRPREGGRGRRYGRFGGPGRRDGVVRGHRRGVTDGTRLTAHGTAPAPGGQNGLLTPCPERVHPRRLRAWPR
ncbi:DNA-binding response OmpR family regulator [Streptomyces turgidiscabies]|uniref:DNA-binding response OmpR family regulator n=2 Tax=Streptomyces TaxID=1883 RepID=A0ABU0RNU0_9ACTN|nr:DNA-binding response OmpR family regulator [Streptomyces turgidiscabies]